MGGTRRRREQTQDRGEPPDLAGWVLPWWLRHQLDPDEPAPDPGVVSRAGRAWTPIGLPDHAARWSVDASGAVGPAAGRWSIDWWVGADDRWHVPSAEAAVRQRLLGVAAVVETRLRVPGGDVVATHWAAPSRYGPPVVCLEVVNAGARAVAVAVALRPWGPLGLGLRRRLGLRAGGLTADGVTILRAETPPRQAAFSDAAGGDVAAVVLAHSATTAVETEMLDADGWATAALIWPLAPRAALRFEIAAAPKPDAPTPRTRRGATRQLWAETPGGGREVGRPRAQSGASADEGAGVGGEPGRPRAQTGASADEVGRGWAARVERVTRLGLPDGPLATAIAVARRRLLLASGDARPPAGDHVALLSAALASSGCRDEAVVAVQGWRHEGDLTATAATLWALGRWAATGPDDDGLIPGSAVVIAEAAEAVGRGRSRHRPRSDRGPLTDTVWTVAGLRSAAALLAGLGEVGSAAVVARWAEARTRDLVAGLTAIPFPAGGDDAVRAGLLGVHLGVLDARHPSAVAARRAAQRAAGARGFPAQPDAGGVPAGPPGEGHSPYLTLLLATSAVLGGDDPTGPLAWVLSVAGPTWTWPPAVDGIVAATAQSRADDPLVSVAWWALGRALLLDDQAASPPPQLAVGPARIEGVARVRLALFPWLPEDWWGRDVEVHGMATAAGLASWALRWHGRRPALLWEVKGPGPDVEWRAPGIDATWSATGRRGEALIGAHHR